MPTILFSHRGVTAPAGAPVLGYTDVELQIAKLPGLRAWWRADESYRPTAGGSWRDRINDIPLTLARNTWPVRTPGGAGGHDFLQFQAGGTVLESPAAAALWPLNPNPWTFMWIGRFEGPSGGAQGGVFGNRSVTNASVIFYNQNVGDSFGAIYGRENGAPISNTVDTFAPNTPDGLYVVSRNPLASEHRFKVYVNSEDKAITGTGNPANTNSQLLIGGNLADAGAVTNANFRGRIYDLLVFDRALSQQVADMQPVQQYASERYGIPMA